MIKKKLGEIVDVYSGQILGRVKPDSKKGVEYVTTKRVSLVVPKAITSDGLIDKSELVEEEIVVADLNFLGDNKKNIELEMPVDNRRFVSLGDIVIKLSTPFDSATITDAEDVYLVPSFCAIIRNRGEVDLDYLQAFLNSDVCKNQLKAKVVGSVVTILSIGKIKDVEIPIPTIKEQIEIGKRYRETQCKISTLKKIIELEKKRIDMQILNMVK